MSGSDILPPGARKPATTSQALTQANPSEAPTLLRLFYSRHPGTCLILLPVTILRPPHLQRGTRCILQ
ncbi:MAG: hypothetical protein QOD67_1290 [Caballeronia sp.]|nr:hypothetical protein [Caballeronia sp.]